MIDTFCASLNFVYSICFLQQDNQIILFTDVFSLLVFACFLFFANIVYNFINTGTRPDLCYIVTKLSQKMSKPSQVDLNRAKHVLRYLKGASELSLIFRKSNTPLTLSVYCDSDWGASTTDPIHHRKTKHIDIKYISSD